MSSVLGPAAVAVAGIVCLFLAGARLRGLFVDTALLAVGACLIALPLGAVLGTAIAKIDFPGRRALRWLLVGMLFVPLYVQAGAWQSVLGSGGWWARLVSSDSYAEPWLDGWRGAIWVHGMAAVPWAALIVGAALAAVERRLEEESLLDATPLRVLVRVTLPRALGGLVAAAAWMAVTCATDITVSDLYQIRTFAEEAYTEASLGMMVGPVSGAGMGIPLGVTPLEPMVGRELGLGVAALALVLLAAVWLAAPWAPMAAAIASDGGWKWRPARRGAVGALVWSLAAAIVFVPLAGLAWKAGIEVHQDDGAYHRSWSTAKLVGMIARSPWEHRREWFWSLEIGVLAAAAATGLALALAWAACGRRRVAAPVAVGLVLLATIPAPLLGVGVIAALNRPPESPLAGLAVLYDRTLAAPILVQVVRILPPVALWLWLQLTSVPYDLIESARSEGAGLWTRLVRVALPLRRAGLAVGGVAALAIAVGELSATLLVLPPGVTTVSVRVFQLLHYGVDDRVSALCLAIFGAIGLGVGAAAAVRAVRSEAIERDGGDRIEGGS